jgi:hypothetical protein
MNYPLYYFIAWPECQKVQDFAPKEYWSFTDPDTYSGIFVEKKWFDIHMKDYGF